MSQGPASPLLTAGEIVVTRVVVLHCDCPKCKRPLNITDVKAGAGIQCPDCENMTWAPDYRPKWWFRLRNYALSLLVSFILGVLASLLANHIDGIREPALPATSQEEGL